MSQDKITKVKHIIIINTPEETFTYSATLFNVDCKSFLRIVIKSLETKTDKNQNNEKLVNW